jgi:predicted nucleotidyltransferase
VNLSESDLTKINAWAEQHPEIERIYLYGSRARGDHRPDSDIDLAIDMPFELWFDWHSRYERHPDLHLSHPPHLEWFREDADLERVGPAVRKDGILLYHRNAT